MNLVRQPLVQFVVLGLLLGGVLYWLSDRQSSRDEEAIRLSVADVARMEAEWKARWMRPPQPQELDGLIRAQVRERVLHREALAMGLDRDEPIVRRVLVQKLERIVRDLVELSLAPSDLDLQKYYDANAESYRPAALVTFTHVFVDPDKRGDTAVADAERIVEELHAEAVDSAAAAERYGDRFMLQRYYADKPQQRVASLFGSEFAEVVFQLAPGEWHGPVPSGYGLHAVFVHARDDPPVPALDEIRDEVRRDWVEENRQEITDRYYADLLAKYEVVVEGRVEEAPTDAAPGS